MNETHAQSFSLEGQVAVVTGGGHGLGRATAIALARAGAVAVIADIEADAAEAVAGEIRAEDLRAEAEALDVTDEAAVDRVTDDVASRHGRLDVLVNNAGTGVRMPAEDMPRAEWDRVIDLNQTAVFLCARAAARHMLAQGHGAIVNVASIMGLRGRSIRPTVAYHASKGAVVNMTRALACEWGDRGIRVNAVAPTFVRTRITAALLDASGAIEGIERDTPLRRLATPEEVASAIVFLASPAASMVTGHTLPVDGGWLAR